MSSSFPPVPWSSKRVRAVEPSGAGTKRWMKLSSLMVDQGGALSKLPIAARRQGSGRFGKRPSLRLFVIDRLYWNDLDVYLAKARGAELAAGRNRNLDAVDRQRACRHRAPRKQARFGGGLLPVETASGPPHS